MVGRAKSKIKIYKHSYLFVLPSVIILGFLGLAIVGSNIWISFLKWSILSPPQFIGIKNYVKLFNDPRAHQAIFNTFYYAALYVLPTIFISLLVALLLNRRIRAMGIFRAIYYIPVVTSYVIVIVIWHWFYDYDVGLFNYFLSFLGIRKIPWLLDTRLALPSLVVMSVWKNSGYSILIFLAGLQNVDEALYDVARVDGANKWNLFWHVTIPQLKPTILFTSIMVTTWSFQMFAQPYLLTQGGPLGSTTTWAYYLYKQAFTFYNVGYGSTVTIVGVLIFFTIISIERKLLK